MLEKDHSVIAVTAASPAPLGCLTWSNLGYVVDVKIGKKVIKKSILENMGGKVSAGEVVGIMGGSGAGKSSLMNTLAGRIGAGTLTGDILVDGKPRNPGNWKVQCAYVEQDDIMFSNLSVFETLRYAAFLRLPSSLSVAHKLERVEKVISSLGLEGCRNTWIGNSEARGISGGERKRVAIGIELVSDPQILFLDEPTSGLDAFNALNIITTIKELAKKEGKIVLMTIHQPRTDILNLLDKVVLLSMGKCVFNGSNREALAHFGGLGFHIPDNVNPSDFYLDITTYDQRSEELRKETKARIEMFVAAYDALNKDFTVVKSEDLKTFKTQWPSNWVGEFSTLLGRNMVNALRDKAVVGSTIGQGLFLMILVGFIFFRLGNDFAGIQSRNGVLFFITINQTFGKNV